MVYPKGHKVLIMLAAITCGMAIAACGSSKSSSTAAAAGQFAQGVKYADCMRSHGVTGFPDPSAGGGFALPSTINPQSPSYQVACEPADRGELLHARARRPGAWRRGLVAARHGDPGCGVH